MAETLHLDASLCFFIQISFTTHIVYHAVRNQKQECLFEGSKKQKGACRVLCLTS